MTDDQRKMLTEWMGECWHDWECAEFATLKCKFCGKWIYEKNAYVPSNRRTFTTWQDLGDVKEKLVEKGLWWEFEQHFCLIKWDWVEQEKYQSFNDWLFRPTIDGTPHFCRLVAEFLEGRK